jgi:hypothetical protein
MKQHLIPVLVLLVLASGLVAGCVQEAVPNSTISPTSAPNISQGEACDLVYTYLEAKITAITDYIERMRLLEMLGDSRPNFVANYQGNNTWQVSALGYVFDGLQWVFNSKGGLWNIYEASVVIEPANNQARQLLNRIQTYES